MREIRQSGLEGGVRSIPHSYPYQKITNATKRARSLDNNIRTEISGLPNRPGPIFLSRYFCRKSSSPPIRAPIVRYGRRYRSRKPREARAVQF